VAPGAPRLILDDCAEAARGATEAIEASEEVIAEAYAIRGLARLCLGEDVRQDLSTARDHQDELTAETQSALTAVIAAGLPEGRVLQEVVADAIGAQTSP
jgi:hypothetical protein